MFHIAFRHSSSSPPYPLPSSLPRTQVSTAGSTCTCTCTNSVAEYRLPCRAICAHPCAPPTCIRLYRYQRVNVESARTYTHIHIRAYMYVLAHTCIPQSTHIQYTCAIRDRTRDCTKRALVQTFSRSTYTRMPYSALISTWRRYVRTYCARACVNCTLHACARGR